MNKHGFSDIASLLIMFFLIMMGVAILTATHVPNASYDSAKSNLTWRELSPTSNNTIITISYGFVNFMGSSTFLLTKDAMEWAYNHPNINPYWLIYGALGVVFIPLLWPAFLIITSLILIIKEAFANRRERKELKRLKLKQEFNNGQ